MIRFACLAIGALLLGGCEEKEAPPPAAPAATPVIAVKAIVRDIPDLRTYPGTTQSPMTVAIDARVKGYLEARFFEEGDDVASGDELYLIQPDQYQAELERAEAEVGVARTNLHHANLERDRNEPLALDGAISQQEWDGYVKAAEDAASRLVAAEAELVDAELQLSYTSVAAPLDGRIGATQVDVGNLVGPGSTETLAQIVQLDPMRVVFSPSSREYPAFEQARRSGAVSVTVTVLRRGASPQKYQGVIDLLDNTARSQSSTFAARAQFASPEKLVLPSQLVSVEVRLGTTEGAVLVPSSALVLQHTDHYVYVVKPDWTVEARRVQLGEEVGALTHIKSGVKEGEAVVASATPQLRAGAKVSAKLEDVDRFLKEDGTPPDEKP